MRKQPKINKLKATYDYTSGPVKIKDGLFIGDQMTARDMDFIMSNKVTHIINTVVKKIPNLWEKYGIFYLSVHWTEKQQNIFDKKNQAIQQIYNFIEEADELGQCVLVHSINGKSRASAVVLGYLMKKYQWSLQKSLQYLESKKPHLRIRDNFINQLKTLEQRLKSNSHQLNCKEQKNAEVLLINNTYKNSKIPKQQIPAKKNTKKRIKWAQKISNKQSARQERVILTSQQKYLEYKQIPKKLKGILKGYQSSDESELAKSISQMSDQQIAKERNSNRRKVEADESEARLAKSQMIGNIRGNVVNVTVNNYITLDESALKHNLSMKSSNRYNSIQQRDKNSSTRKQIQKKPETRSGSRFTPYQNIISSFRSPYDSNFMSKIGANTKNKKKQEESQDLTSKTNLTAQRPSSLGGRQLRKPKTYAELLSNSSKKSALYGINKEHILRYK